MEIKIINVNSQLFGVQKTVFGEFHNHNERYPYLGDAMEGQIVNARLVYQANYPGDQWADMPDWIAQDSDRITRRVYFDSRD